MKVASFGYAWTGDFRMFRVDARLKLIMWRNGHEEWRRFQECKFQGISRNSRVNGQLSRLP